MFKDKIKALLYEKSDEDLTPFIKQLKIYLKEKYPKIDFTFNFNQILKEDSTTTTKKYLIVDNIIEQYIALEFHPKPIGQVKSDQIWSSYAFNSKPYKNKLPDDWLQRKSVLFQRDKQTCQRCSQKLTIKDADIFIVKPIKDGGEYYFENLVICCTDCTKIENYKRDKSTNIKNLNIKNNLYSLV